MQLQKHQIPVALLSCAGESCITPFGSICPSLQPRNLFNHLFSPCCSGNITLSGFVFFFIRSAQWLEYNLTLTWLAVILGACNLTEEVCGEGRGADVSYLGLQICADLWFDAWGELKSHLLPIFTINNLLLTGPD